MTAIDGQDAAAAKALIIFAKMPRPGEVKTRLSPALPPEEAAALYHCMLLDTLDTARQLTGITTFVFYQETPGAARFFAAIAPGMTLIPQSGSDLGAKMESAFREVFRRGFLVTAIIGSDSPDLPAEYISRAFSLLEKGESDAVFGPSTDGGYYLLAMRQLRAGLFREIPWSSDAVLAMSIARAESANIQVKLLPTWHDIDSAADLRRPDLWREDSPATRTLAFLRNSNRLV